MKTIIPGFNLGFLTLVLLSTFNFQPSTLQAQNVGVSYQGRVLVQGSGFTGTSQIKFALVTSNDLNSTATAVADPPSGGFITVINVTDGGHGYSSAPAVTISGGGGSGATATTSIGHSAVTNITVNNPGSGYTSTPTVTIASPPINNAFVTFWSNDQTSTNGNEPTSSVSVPVNNGLFTVVLGDTTLSNMAPLSALLFEQAGLQLRIWFNTGTNAFTLLRPPQVLTTAPYAGMVNTVSQIYGTQFGTNPVFSGAAFADSFSSTSGLFIGGENNTIGLGANASTISGGSYNGIGANSYAVTVGGGEENTVGAGGTDGTIGGGEFNGIGTNSSYTTIGGGVNNGVAANDNASFIGGGEYNRISGPGSVILGGLEGVIGTNAQAVIGGGLNNQIGSAIPVDGYFYPAIGGGSDNSIGDNAGAAVIAGGSGNHIGDGPAGYFASSVVAGGYQNSIGTNGFDGFIGGGAYNQTGNGFYQTTIVGGYQNTISSNASYSIIAGGDNNQILHNANQATVAAGANNIAGGEDTFAAGDTASATNDYSFVWSDGSATTSSRATESVTFRASGGYRFFTGSGTSGAKLAAGATAWSTLCDRNLKKNFRLVDPVAVLNKLAALPIEQWNYRWEKDSDVPNIGPMAQDFKAAFYAGRDDKTITTLEFDGVELAAIQGLNEKLDRGTQKAETQMEQIGAQAAALKSRLERLEALVKSKTVKN